MADMSKQEVLKIVAQYVAPLQGRVTELEKQVRKQKSELSNLRSQVQRNKK